MSIDIERRDLPMTAMGDLQLQRAEQVESQQERTSEVVRRGLGANALDAHGNEIPNSAYWKIGLSPAEQHWPRRV